MFILGFSSIFTGINFIATVHKLRAPGHGLVRHAAVLSGPCTRPRSSRCWRRRCSRITLLLLTMERAFQIGIFDPSLGGDPVLFQHFFWFYSHPAVYIMILPGLAIISARSSRCSRRKTIFGYRAIAFSTSPSR